MEDSKSGLYIIAIVGIVAVVALIIMVTGASNQNVIYSGAADAVAAPAYTTDSSGAASDVAYSDTTCIYEDNSETIGCPCRTTNLWNSELALDLC